MSEMRIRIDWTTARMDGEDIVVPIPPEGRTIEVMHYSDEAVPGVAALAIKAKPYKLLGHQKGVQLR